MDRQLDVLGLRFLQSASLIIGRQRVDIYTDHLLGGGSYGKVFKATFESAECVAKKLHPQLLPRESDKLTVPYRRFLSECKISCHIRHPHIVQFFGVTIDDGVPCLIMEIMHQSLSARISSETQFPRKEKINSAEGIAAGLKYLHASPLRIVHRDLSANNILLSFDGKAKICDFGLAKQLPEGDVVKSTRCPGTPAYMAPEVLGDPAIYATASDMYSYGVLLVEIDIQERANPHTRKHAIQRMDRSGPLYSIALECLRDDHKQRLNADTVSAMLKSFYDGQSSIENAKPQMQVPVRSCTKSKPKGVTKSDLDAAVDEEEKRSSQLQQQSESSSWLGTLREFFRGLSRESDNPDERKWRKKELDI